MKQESALHYDTILHLVSNEGYTIEEACKAVKVSRKLFYNSMTDLQKENLKKVKMANAKYGRGDRFSQLPVLLDNDLNF
jgi:hypothetical protein